MYNQWSLNVFYTGIDDPALEKDMARLEEVIAEYKKAAGMQVLDASRERDKLDAICAKVPPEMRGFTCALYAKLFELSRDYQTQQIADSGAIKCGLLGRKLGHSYSPQIHALLGNYTYGLYEKEDADLIIERAKDDYDGMSRDSLEPVIKKIKELNS